MKKCIIPLWLLTALLPAGAVLAQTPYKLPPQEVIDIVEAPPTPSADVSPSGRHLMLSAYESMPSIGYLSQPLLRIAGIRITPANNSRQQTTFYTGITIKEIATGKETEIMLPENALLGRARWSPDERLITFPRYTDTGAELWIADVGTGRARRLTAAVLNLTAGRGYIWHPDGKRLLVWMIPAGRGEPPQPSRVPAGPVVQESDGTVSQVRTYQDLLKDPRDEALFDYYATSRLMEIDTETGAVTPLGESGIYSSADYSPDGRYLLVDRIERPYSYAVSYYSFPHVLEIWDSRGALVRRVADLPLADQVPLHGVQTGPRSMSWRPLEDAALVWVEALDGGDPKTETEFRDELYTLPAPFTGTPRPLYQTHHRFAGIGWLEKKGLALISEYDWTRRWSTTSLVHVDKPATEPKVIFDLSTQDRYGDPGRPVARETARGETVLITEGNSIYLSGPGASPRGDRPFLDKMDLTTLKTKRLFQCGEACYETFSGFSGNGTDSIVIQHESKTDVPNYFLVSLKKNTRRQLTRFSDPAPQLTGISKQLITYTRDDGVDLSGTLYLPVNYRQGERLPLVLWAYPVEYSDPAIAGQVRGSAHRFTFFRGYSQLFFLTQGYAVLDGAQMPVVGDPETMNDTFVEQIVGSARAAIDKLDEMGVIDPNRVGVGGHSYGAFMTANLLAHCDLFAAGIARSGAYNRTLTPFGFQSERRTFWEAPRIYFTLSPFMHADKVNEPILLIHGMADNNSGTFPIQSERFFHALKGHGATARLVMLPNESHGYRARESVLHVLAEMFDWFDTHVKNRHIVNR
ncbi:S9 family peptidase [bacterium]|nr:S9 family peptidase [bacterium]